MTDDVVVNKDATLTNIAGLHNTAQSLDSAQQAFLEKVQGLVEKPGNDMISPLIWTAHDAVLQILHQCVSSNVHGIRTHADKWSTTQQIHDMVEHANVDHIRAV